MSDLDPRLMELVRADRISIGVFPSFQYSRNPVTGQPQGLALEIARSLAPRLGFAGVATIESPTPAHVVTCVKTGGCDLGFLNIDPARATEVDFTPPFVRSEFTYLLPAHSHLRRSADIDHAGTRIATIRGHASTAALERIIMKATPVYAESYEDAVDLLRSGRVDAFASIREMLLQYAARCPGSRMLNDGYASSQAGIAIAKGHPGRLAYISEYLDHMKQSGSLGRIIDDLGVRGIEVVAPQATVVAQDRTR
jgi:polar amino acid transport system substrate-binding protein